MLAGIGQGVVNRLLGDLVKHQAVDRHLGLEHLAQMPTDRLAFAVFVRRQDTARSLSFSKLLAASRPATSSPAARYRRA